MIHFHTNSAEETKALAAGVAQAVQDRDFIVLAGEVGSGKTTFAQGFGKALGIEEQITSPTFVLMRTYQAPMKLHHADIYRIDYLQEVIDLGLLEILDEGGVALMEWGDMAAPVLPRDFLEVKFEIDEMNDDARRVRIRGVGATWALREKVLRDFVAEWIVEGDASEGEQQ